MFVKELSQSLVYEVKIDMKTLPIMAILSKENLLRAA